MESEEFAEAGIAEKQTQGEGGKAALGQAPGQTVLEGLQNSKEENWPARLGKVFLCVFWEVYKKPQPLRKIPQKLWGKIIK